MTLSRILDARRGPDRLVLVRHGESVGNLADAEARERGSDRLDLDARDADVELSDTGQKQADAVGRWLARGAGRPADGRAQLAVPPGSGDRAPSRRRRGIEVILDERLRERDLGIFDGLTGQGIRSAYPEEAERRREARQVLLPAAVRRELGRRRPARPTPDVRDPHGFDGAHVWLFTHQAVIMSFRYVLEGLDEERAARVDGGALGNASMTRYKRGDSGYELEAFADTRRSTSPTRRSPTRSPRRGRGTTAEPVGSPRHAAGLAVARAGQRQGVAWDGARGRRWRRDARRRPARGEAALRVGGGAAAGHRRLGRGRLAAAVPEALVRPCRGGGRERRATAVDGVLEFAEGADVVLLGPGLSGVDASVALLGGVVHGSTAGSCWTRSPLPTSPSTPTVFVISTADAS